MKTPTPRRRAIAALVALPLAIAAAPLTGVAHATTATLTPLTVPSNRVGPNAGWLDPAQGIGGTTPIVRLTLDNGSVTLKEFVLNVSGPSVSIFRDFASNDGFALYRDLGAPGFTAEDHAAGPVSDGLRVGTPSGGRIPLTLTTDPEKATGSSAYFLTVHPAKANVGDRTFTVTIDAGAVVTSDASTTNSELALPPLTIDSRAPVAPHERNFANTTSRNPPGQEDTYTIGNERHESDKSLAFFATGVGTGLDNLLIHPDGSYVVHPAPPFSSPVKIGDGSGRTRTIKVSPNKQTTDDTFVRAVDSIGNLTEPALRLTGGNSNFVTAPNYTAWNVSLPATGINAMNQHAVEVTTSGTPANEGGVTVGGEQVRLVGIDANGSQIAFTDWVTLNPARTDGGERKTPVDARPLGSAPTRVLAQSRLIGPVAFGSNIQDIVQSAPVSIDLTRPTIDSISSLIDSNPAGPSAGDTFRVFFSEPMRKSTIPESTEVNGVRPTCADAGPCINGRLKVNGGASNWGRDPAFKWAADGLSATITLGSETYFDPPDLPGQPPTTPVGAKLAKVGDLVAATADVTDLNGNTVANTVTILNPGLMPLSAQTFDRGGLNLFEQKADGFVDEIDLTMAGELQGALNSALDPAMFQFTTLAGTINPTTATLFEATKIRFTFANSVMRTGEVPVLRLVDPEGDGTGLFTKTGVPVNPFSIKSTDKAIPALIRAVTRDANGNGHIDSIVLTWSENIDHSREQVNQLNGYFVPGYGNSDPVQRNSSTPATGYSNETIVNLKENAAFDTDALPAFGYFAGAPTATDTLSQDQQTVLVKGSEICDGEAAPTAPANCRGQGRIDSRPSDPYFDGAAPVIVNRKTIDIDADGFVDAVAAQFSEPIRTDTIGNATFTVTDRTITGVVPVFTGSPDTVYVRVEEAPEGDGDTATKLKLQYTGGLAGGVHDAATPTSNSATAEKAAVESLDGSGPAIVAASTVPADGGGPGDGTKVNVVLSEATEQLSTGDFEVIGRRLSNTNQLVSQEPIELTVAQDKKSAELTLETAISPLLDGTVEFTGTGVVVDQVLPTPNLNTQVHPVPIPPFPVATLDARGPQGSANGYSTSRTFTTGAAGNTGVTGWCLKVANVPIEAEPTAPQSADDPCFKAEVPATFTAPIDGTYKLLLVTRNRFGNLSTPATDTIVVDTTRPLTTSVFIERLGVGRVSSIRDNDQLRVVTTISGSPTGLTATADYSALTGNAGDTAVPNLSRSGGTFYFPFRTASGTTMYPVGTVLAVNNDAGQPFILEDGPNETIVKRRFLSAQAMSTYRIPSNLVIRVPAAVLNRIPNGPTPTKFYRDGQLVRASNSHAVYVVTENTKRLIPDRATFDQMRYSFTAVIVVPPADLAKVPSGEDMTVGKHPVGTYVRNNSLGTADYGKTYVILRGADNQLRKRHVVSSTALLSHITSNQIVNVPRDHTSLKDVETDALKRGMRDGMLIREPNDPRVFVVSRGARRHINSRGAFDSMGFSFRNVIVVGSEHVGIPVDSTVPVGTRRVPFSVTLRDQAGNVSTRESTVVGLGIPEPLPATAPGAPRP